MQGMHRERQRTRSILFFADRSFVYMTGVAKESLIFTALKTDTAVEETMFILPPDENAERWTGARIRAQEVESMAGIQKCRYISEFGSYLKGVLTSLKADTVCLDFDRFFEDEQPKEAFVLAEIIKKDYPYINLRNIHKAIAHIRTIKKPCEIEAMRKAEAINREGIIRMMQASRPGMFEYHSIRRSGIMYLHSTVCCLRCFLPSFRPEKTTFVFTIMTIKARPKTAI